MDAFVVVLEIENQFMMEGVQINLFVAWSSSFVRFISSFEMCFEDES